MAHLLYAVARWAATRRRLVLSAWLLLLIVIGGLGGALHGTLSSVFSVPGIESQNAQDLLQARFPAVSGGTARIVFAAPPGSTLTTATAERAITSSLRGAAKIPGVIVVTDPFTARTVSASKAIGFADVIFRQLAPQVPQSAKNHLDNAMRPARSAGLQVQFGGTAEAAGGKVGGLGEIIGVAVAFVVLAITLGSLVAAGLPLLTALAGVAIGVSAIEFLSRFIQMTTTASVLATMIGLAVGIDYALFIISRHREQLTDPGQAIGDSIGRAAGTAGSAVVFAGTTVIIALCALATSGIPFLTVMGVAAAGTVLLAVIAAVTLVPAILGFAGEKLRPKTRTGRQARAWARRGVWGLAWARGIRRAPLAVLLACLLGLLVLALPARHLRLGLPGNET